VSAAAANARAVRLAVDIGGTFTDLVAYDGETHELRTAKVLTTADDRAAGVLQALDASGVEPLQVGEFIHGTTAATNAVLEGTTAPTALITTAGFRDALELMRGDRPMPVYDIGWRKPDPLIPRARRFEVPERLDAAGAVVTPLDEGAVRKLLRADAMADVEAVAICFLHSFLHDAHERRVAEIVAEERPELHVSLSCDVNPEVREYERTSTVALDAMLKPLVTTYLRALEARLAARGIRSGVLVMLANAGVMPIVAAEARPISTLHSGPAGGVVGATLAGRALGRANVITADMGGTSFDVCAIADGRPRFRSEGQIRFGIPFRMPLVDVGTIGAGGGSIGWVDPGGLLRVGPRSAGADPGPACYGLGGETATVTDACCALGYFGDTGLAGGAIRLRPERARAAIGALARRLGRAPDYVADGMLQIAIAHMAGEIRKNSVERGDDPRDFSLLSFGGAGSMFAGVLARMLGMHEVIVPPHAGVFSAWGMLGADLRHDAQRTVYGELATLHTDALREAFAAAEAAALAEFDAARADVELQREVALRYVGQRHELRVPLAAPIDDASLAAARRAFDRAHAGSYGHERPDDAVEIRAIGVTAVVPREPPRLVNGGRSRPLDCLVERRRIRLTGTEAAADVPVYDRTRLGTDAVVEGPAVLESPDATVVVHPHQRAVVHRTGSLLVST
jgi:N-methylhydantoinase A